VQDQSGVTLHNAEKSDDGYTLYSSRQSEAAHLIDMSGREVHQWSYPQGLTWHYAEMVADGHLLAIIKEEEGRVPGMVIELDWDGGLVWQADVTAHHDLGRLATGNTLVLCREYVEHPAIRSGDIKSDFFVELTPENEIVWEWHVHEHALEMAELVRIEFPAEQRDWAHTNTVESLLANPSGEKDKRFRAGNVLFSCRHTDTIGVVDRDTGEVVWAWGPGELSKQHMPTMLPSGHVLIFDNGNAHGRSRIVELDPLAGRIVWQYVADPPEAFFSSSRGASERLPNGNTFVTESNTGHLFEVTPEGETVWEFLNPDLKPDGKRMALYRALRYPKEQVEQLLAARG